MKPSTVHSALRLFNAIVFLSFLCAGVARAGNLFSGPINSPAGRYPWALAAGDFNGDGDVDLAVTNNDTQSNHKSHVRILLGEGSGIFELPVSYPVGAEPNSVAVGDFNRDGNLDLAVISYGNSPKSLGVLLGNGDGTLQPQVRYKVGLGAVRVLAGDFNGDGKPDLAVANRGEPGFVSVLLGNGDGTFQAQVKTKARHSPGYIAAGDLNGDGRLDLVVGDICGCPKPRINVLLGNGNGTFTLAWTAIGRAPSAIALGDFNDDGKLDLAETEIGGSRLRIRLGRGDGTFRKAADYAVGVSPDAIAIADFDGDGNLDVAVANEDSHDVSLLVGNGDGTFKPAASYPLTVGARALATVTADVNGDGRPDLVVTDYLNHVVSVLLNTGHK